MSQGIWGLRGRDFRKADRSEPGQSPARREFQSCPKTDARWQGIKVCVFMYVIYAMNTPQSYGDKATFTDATTSTSFLSSL
jgi:hypothetical protein